MDSKIRNTKRENGFTEGRGTPRTWWKVQWTRDPKRDEHNINKETSPQQEKKEVRKGGGREISAITRQQREGGFQPTGKKNAILTVKTQ